jgi:hypothetical protein
MALPFKEGLADTILMMRSHTDLKTNAFDEHLLPMASSARGISSAGNI